METPVRPLVCQQCANERARWGENCSHVTEFGKSQYHQGLQDRARPRLTSEDVHRALSDLSLGWKNFYHLAADALNRILDEKDKV